MDYGAILSRAWEILTRHKVLWLFGILAALGSGGGGGVNYSTSSEEVGEWVTRLGQAEMIALACVAASLGLLVLVVVVALSTMGHIGLVKGVLAVEAGAERLAFGALWNDSRPYFWRMLGLVVSLVVAAVAIVVALVLLGITIVGLVVVVPAICLLLLASPLLFGYVNLASVSVVADEVGPLEALGLAWRKVRARAVEVWIMGFLLCALLVVAAGILGVIVALLLTPVAILAELIGPAVWLLGVLILPVALLGGGILQTYTSTVWTLVYKRLPPGSALGGAGGYLPVA